MEGSLKDKGGKGTNERRAKGWTSMGKKASPDRKKMDGLKKVGAPSSVQRKMEVLVLSRARAF